MSYQDRFAVLMKKTADKYDHRPEARPTGPVVQDQLEEDALANAFLKAYSQRSTL